jgi:hypothetical protein
MVSFRFYTWWWFSSALEAFIRAKYEQRKWIAKEWIPPEITVSNDVSVVLFAFEFTYVIVHCRWILFGQNVYDVVVFLCSIFIYSWSNRKQIHDEMKHHRTLHKSVAHTFHTNDACLIQKAKSVPNNIPKLKGFATPAPVNNPVRQQGIDRPLPAMLPSMPIAPVPTPISVVQSNQQSNLLGLGKYWLYMSIVIRYIYADEPTLPLSSNHTLTSTKIVTADIVDPLHELFSPSSMANLSSNTGNGNPVTMTNLNKDLESAFSSSNTNSTTGGIMSTDKIMALFNTPQLSTAAPLPSSSSSGINLGLSSHGMYSYEPLHISNRSLTTSDLNET